MFLYGELQDFLYSGGVGVRGMVGLVDANDTPLTPEQAGVLKRFLADVVLRLNSLFWIVNKDGIPCRFRMNWAQKELHETAHFRNNILKVRQLGISTYIAMLILDMCLFIPHFKAGIIDKTLNDAESKLKKIAFAWDHLDYVPENPSALDLELARIGAMLKAYHAGIKINQQSIEFANGSRVTVGTSLRGDTLQLLHVSELGYIAAHDPIRATEIITGSLNTVGKGGRVHMESTHEGGKYGLNYEQILGAMDMIGKPLSSLDFKFYFSPGSGIRNMFWTGSPIQQRNSSNILPPSNRSVIPRYRLGSGPGIAPWSACSAAGGARSTPPRRTRR